MANLTQVGISAGVPNSGTGTVSTIDALMADGGQATIGAKADAAWDGSSAASGVSIWKYVGSKIEAVRALLAGTLNVATHAVTQSGSWVLSAGSAIVGKVGIDQTTDGTTNLVAAKAAQVSTTTATIANGASLSGAVDCSAGRLARIDMPSAWTAANLTFQVSPDNTTFTSLFDNVGNEYTAVVTAVSTSIVIPLVDFIGARYIKVRSGTSGTPVNQGASRALTLTLVP